ncbi:hypothetical protein CSUB01_03536 [Colletotrichum sublineola]|uniref:Uncharacterized protein n=1 Tax=Colletotrichum sublineola TaxID=1173701 RepID=A0A066X7U9_COLSU|nr:hypothetical protein CSUB01_03536 [Colletotrichum sublineola]
MPLAVKRQTSGIRGLSAPSASHTLPFPPDSTSPSWAFGVGIAGSLSKTAIGRWTTTPDAKDPSTPRDRQMPLSLPPFADRSHVGRGFSANTAAHLPSYDRHRDGPDVNPGDWERASA